MNRLEWLQWRKEGIGSSDAPIIMGCSDFFTPLKLYEEKIAPEVVDRPPNFIQERGIRMEPRIRSLFEMIIGKAFEPKLFVMDGFKFLRASMDGTSADKEIIEIKISGAADWAGAKEGKVPEKYIPQIQHQFLVSGYKSGYYLSYLYEKEEPKVLVPEKLAVVKVFPDKEYIENLFKEEIRFWNCVETKKPPISSDKDFKKLNSAELNRVAERYLQLKKEASAIDSELEYAKEILLTEAANSGVSRLLIGKLKLTQVSREGNVDYKAIPELKGVDLAKYRKPGSSFWKIE